VTGRARDESVRVGAGAIHAAVTEKGAATKRREGDAASRAQKARRLPAKGEHRRRAAEEREVAKLRAAAEKPRRARRARGGRGGARQSLAKAEARAAAAPPPPNRRAPG